MMSWLKISRWERYFYSELIKLSMLFISCIFFLYFLIDYSSNGNQYTSNGCGIFTLTTYYLLVFLKHIDILLPFALLLATIKTLCMLNSNNEIVAMLASGVRLRRLLRPFAVVGMTAVVLMYINFELLIPSTLYKVKLIESAHEGENPRKNGSTSLQSFTLYDGSFVLYQNYDSLKEHFFDVFWIRSLDEIFRIKYLYPDPNFTVGRFVDHFVRSDSGQLERLDSQETQMLSEMNFDDELLFQTLRLAEDLSISQLWSRLPENHAKPNDKEAQALTWFYLRLLTPWLCFFSVVAPAPFCIRFTRQLRPFLIYAMSIFVMIGIHSVISASTVLSQSQVISPAIAILTPVSCIFAYFLYKFLRID
jgi:lipopolysaccharide export system permease protein